MSENKSEQANLQPKEIQLAQWFRPFEGYTAVPYAYDREDYKAKDFPLKLKEIGLLTVGLYWDHSEFLPEVENGTIILSDVEINIPSPNTTDYEEEMETKLFEIGLITKDDRHQGKELPYMVEVKTPKGTVLSNHFELGEELDEDCPPGVNRFKREGKSEGRLLVPEIPDLLGKIQMRIAPIRGGEK